MNQLFLLINPDHLCMVIQSRFTPFTFIINHSSYLISPLSLFLSLSLSLSERDRERERENLIAMHCFVLSFNQIFVFVRFFKIIGGWVKHFCWYDNIWLDVCVKYFYTNSAYKLYIYKLPVFEVQDISINFARVRLTLR